MSGAPGQVLLTGHPQDPGVCWMMLMDKVSVFFYLESGRSDLSADLASTNL